MVPIRRILCPIDFSDFSRRALDHAIAIARWYEATVTALHVFSPMPVAPFAPGIVGVEPIVVTEADRAHLLAEVTTFIQSEAAPGVPMEAVVREGNTVSEILNQASSMSADLLVMGTHGRSGFERLLLGSVAERVLRKASCPVMTVPTRLPDAVPAGPVVYKRILCPIDFSPSSLHALHYAVSLSEEADGELTVLHVVAHEFENTPDMADAVYDPGITMGDLMKERDDALRRRLQDTIAAPTEFCRVEPLLTHGKPWREVLRVATERQSDLIVMGVQGRGAIDLVFLGSTTQHVVREAACPVLTLRRR